MPIEIEVRNSRQIFQQILTFRNFNRSEQVSETYLNWKYFGRPCEMEPFTAMAKKGEQCVGMISVIPQYAILNEQNCTLGILGDIAVAGSEQGKGLATKLLKTLLSSDEYSRLDGALVIPTMQAIGLFEKMGWINIDNIHRFVRPNWKFARCTLNLISGLQRLCSRVEENRCFESLNFSDSRIIRLLEQWNNHKRNKLSRTQDYLIWRYQNHPSEKFDIEGVIEKGILVGLYVYKKYDNKLLVVEAIEKLSCLKECIDYLATKYTNVASIMIRTNSSTKTMFRKLFVKRKDFLPVYYSGKINPSERSWYLSFGDKDV